MYKSFIRYMICKYILSVCSFFFHSLNIVFQRAQVLYFNEIHFSYLFFFIDCAFGVITKKALPNARLQRFSPMFSSRNFIVLIYKGHMDKTKVGVGSKVESGDVQSGGEGWRKWRQLYLNNNKKSLKKSMIYFMLIFHLISLLFLLNYS